MVQKPTYHELEQRVRVLETKIHEAGREKERSEQQTRFKRLLNAVADWVYIVGPGFIIEDQSEAFIGVFGNMAGQKCYNAIFNSKVPCDYCLMEDALRSGVLKSIEATFPNGRTCEGVFSPFTDLDGKRKTIVSVRDITEKKSFQAAAMRAGQLAALGEIAGGIAHEINNPLNGIISYAEILADELGEAGEDTEIPERIIKEGDRMADIVRNLHTFTRHGKAVQGPTRVGEKLQDVIGMTKKQLQKDGIKLRLDIASDIPEIKACDWEMQQVFLDIISNARHALNQKFPEFSETKILDIQCRTVEIEGCSRVRIVFDDHGTGIPAAFMDRIFTPFFSTKPPRHRNRIGLVNQSRNHQRA